MVFELFCLFGGGGVGRHINSNFVRASQAFSSAQTSLCHLPAAMAMPLKDGKWSGPEWTKTWSMAHQTFNQKEWGLHTVTLNFEEGTMTERWRKKANSKDSLGKNGDEDGNKTPNDNNAKGKGKGKMKRPAAVQVAPKTPKTMKKKSKTKTKK